MSKLLKSIARFGSKINPNALLLLIIAGALLITTSASGKRFQWWSPSYWSSYELTNKNTYQQPWVLPALLFGIYVYSIAVVRFKKWRAGKRDSGK
jgi:hypothetical protein